MKPERVCEQARVELSARLDGETTAEVDRWLDSHLESCAGCRDHVAGLERARNAVRVRALDAVPDLTDEILDRVRAEKGLSQQRGSRTRRVRLALVAAAATAALMATTVLPLRDQPASIANAKGLARKIRAAAVDLRAYRAEFSVVERGWHTRVPERRFRTTVAYEAPENMRIESRDLTRYPDRRGWPSNDFSLIANSRSWWLQEEVSCPPQALPGCAAGATTTATWVTKRQPFDGSTLLPTDILVPLETVGNAAGITLTGEGDVGGRSAYKIDLTYRQALPLIQGFQAGGSWRPFYAGDPVQVWIDKETWFPLRFEVSALGSPERARWAERARLRDVPGRVALSAEAVSFTPAPVFLPSTFRVTSTAGKGREGGFSRTRDVPETRNLRPSYTAGLSLYRSGRTAGGSPLVAYASGMTWLKVTRLPVAAADPVAEPFRLASGWAYYLPASGERGRRIEILDERGLVRLESNLSRAELTKVAASLGRSGIERPRRTRTGGTLTVHLTPRQIRERDAFLVPRFVPAGYEALDGTLTKSRFGRTLTLTYSHGEMQYDGIGIRLTQSDSVDVLPPSSQQFDVISIRGRPARWSLERGELEWIEDGRHFSLGAPSLDVESIVEMAESLR